MLEKEGAVSTADLVSQAGEAIDKEDGIAQGASPAPEGTQPGTTGAVEKTPEELAEVEVEGLLKAGKAIPYERFKQLVDTRNKERGERDTLKKQLEELSAAPKDEFLNDPEVVEFALRKKGYSDKEIDAFFSENQLERPVKEPVANKDLDDVMNLVKDLDLNTKEGWLLAQRRIAQYTAKEENKPIVGKLSERENQERQAQIKQQLDTWDKSARDIAKEMGITYGIYNKDESNPKTAVGKMFSYLQKNPEDARLGYVKLLRLAMADEGFKSAKTAGAKEENDRNTILKSAALESQEAPGKEDLPSADWSVQKLVEYAKKNKDKI